MELRKAASAKKNRYYAKPLSLSLSHSYLSAFERTP
jgi:hypothetical protein